jgi:hypothetical protein
LRIAAGQRVIVVAGLPVHHYRAEDAVAEAYAMVFLVESGFAQQTDVAQAFARSVRTVWRYQGRCDIEAKEDLLGTILSNGHLEQCPISGDFCLS